MKRRLESLDNKARWYIEYHLSSLASRRLFCSHHPLGCCHLLGGGKSEVTHIDLPECLHTKTILGQGCQPLLGASTPDLRRRLVANIIAAAARLFRPTQLREKGFLECDHPDCIVREEKIKKLQEMVCAAVLPSFVHSGGEIAVVRVLLSPLPSLPALLSIGTQRV